MEIIREYNYTPNMIARSLSSKDSFNIGIIIPNVGEKQYGKILEGAAKETAKHGYSLVFMDSENDLKTEKKVAGRSKKSAYERPCFSACAQ